MEEKEEGEVGCMGSVAGEMGGGPIKTLQP